jgi:integrase
MEKDDIKDMVEWVKQRDDISYSTFDSYKQVIRCFWKWKNGGEHPEKTEWITTSKRQGKEILPRNLLNREEIDDLIDGCRNSRDRAFIAILWETGARIGELIDSKVGHIEDHRNGKKIVINGKTGARRLPLIESSPYLNRWLNEHPRPVDDMPLWCKVEQHSNDGNLEEGLSYNYIRQKLLERAKERAEVEKPVNPHHFRHSRATDLATEFKEAQLCEWFGWVQGSDVPAKYVHLSGRDIDETYFEMHDLIDKEEKEKKKTIQECPRCQEINERAASFCARCGHALDIKAVEELETAQSETVQTATPEDIELARSLVNAMSDNKQEVENLVNEIAN